MKTTISIGAVLALIVAIFITFAGHGQNLRNVQAAEATEAAAESSIEAMTADEMQTAIMELREMMQSILRLLNNRENAQPSVNVPQVAAAPQAAATPFASRGSRPARPDNPPITADRAVEIALAYVGEGWLDEVSLDFERGAWVWEVEINFTNRRDMDVYIDVNTGEVLWTSGGAPRTERANRPARPDNPPITQARAIEIAFAYVGGEGWLDEASLDFERGMWVWEVEIEFADRSEIEIYIDVNTGEILWTELD